MKSKEYFLENKIIKEITEVNYRIDQFCSKNSFI